MSKTITKQDSRDIATIIRQWPTDEKLTWNRICEASKAVLDYVPTRQAIQAKSAIKTAYKVRKEEDKDRREAIADVPIPKSMPAAVDKIARLEQENTALKAELNKLHEVAQLFIHNASLHGLTPQKLMAPLVEQDRSK